MVDIAYPLAERTLPNGLRVIVSEDHTVPNVTVNLWVKVGSRHEVAGRTGFAHLFEHLMFQGSANVASGEHFAALMALGGRLNATTWFDRTNYFETVPTGALDFALWLEADRHGRLLAAVNQANLDNQRDVVKEEKRQRYDNAPYGNALIDVYATVFPQDHPYHHPTIGSMADLEAATLEDVHAFYSAHYGPNNSVLTLVGDLTPEEGFAAAERYFGPLPRDGDAAAGRGPHADAAGHAGPPGAARGGAQRPAAPGLPAARRPHRRVQRRGAGPGRPRRAVLVAARATSGARRADRDQPGGAHHGVRRRGLARLHHRRRRRRRRPRQGRGGDLRGARRASSPSGPTDEELESALAETERSWLSALANPEERADHICHYAALHDDPAYVNTFLAGLADVTAAQVRAGAARYLHPDSRAVVSYLVDGDRRGQA